MRRRWKAGPLALGAVLLLALTSCSGAPAVTEVAPSESVPTTAIAESNCAYVHDMSTVLVTAQEAIDEGRSNEKEFDDAARLAARVLDRSRPQVGTPLGDSIAALKAVTPLSKTSDDSAGYDPRSEEWLASFSAVVEQCELAGVTTFDEVWAGE